MDTLFLNSGNSKTSHPYRLLLKLLDKIKKLYKNNKFKI